MRVCSVRAERGYAVLLSSHDLHEVSRLADRVVMVARGQVLADEPITAASSAELEEQYFTSPLALTAPPDHHPRKDPE